MELLTSGPEVLEIRDIPDIDTPTLFEEDVFEASPESERRLSALLGAKFDAAWPDPNEETAQLQNLVERLESMFSAATAELLPDAPGPDHPGRSTWEQMSADLHRELRRHLQSDVREALS